MGTEPVRGEWTYKIDGAVVGKPEWEYEYSCNYDAEGRRRPDIRRLVSYDGDERIASLKK